MTGFRIGKILSAHGVRGLVKFRCYLEDIKTLNSLNPVSCADGREITLTIKNANGTDFIAEMKGVIDRNVADTFRGQDIFVDREKLPETEEDEFYIQDLIGAEILNEDNQQIGTLLNIVNFGAGDLLEIKSLTSKNFYCPFIEPFLISVIGKKITITNFEEFMA